MKKSNWSFATRFLHLGLVSTVSIQLFISLVMTSPDHSGGGFGHLAFDVHEIVGMAAVFIVLFHWLATLVFQLDGGIAHLFPITGDARNQVFGDVRNLFKGRLPRMGARGGLPGLVHGLGLMAVTAVATTGAVLFFIFPESGKPGFITEGFAELHEGLAGLVWAYWFAHGGIALLHAALGHDDVRKMFSLRRNGDSANKVIPC